MYKKKQHWAKLVAKLMVFCCILANYPGLVLCAPKCQPTDWTQQANYLLWGSCNWPHSDTPCGELRDVPGRPKGQRAWPHGTCSLKFTRTPWAPGIYPQEKDEGWVCGTRFMRCTKHKGLGRNQTAETLECGGKVAGTEKPCPDDLAGWTCDSKTRMYPNSNCKSDGEDLVLDVSTMGYPDEIQTSRVVDAEQCARMCAFKSGCNVWNYCNETQGCGWSCQLYYDKHREKIDSVGLGLGAITGIAISAAVILIIIIAVAIFCACRRRRSLHIPTHNLLPHDPTKGPPANPFKPTSPPFSTTSSTPIPAGFNTTVGYPMESSPMMDVPGGVIRPMMQVGPMNSPNIMGTGSPDLSSSVGSPSPGAGLQPLPAGIQSPVRPAPRRFMFTGSSESSSEVSSSIYAVQYPQGTIADPATPGSFPTRQQRGANHAVL